MRYQQATTIFLLFMFTVSQAYNNSLDKQVNFNDFVSLIEQSPAKNLDELLPEIKSQNPSLFSRYVLAYRSRSLQEASPQNPRAILFSPDGTFAMAFNGDNKHSGYQNLEVMRFNNSNKKFEFYEISFTAEKAHVSPPNPKKCLDCHQSRHRLDIDPRPNWEPYSIWPGFFGSLGDNTQLFINSIKHERRYDKTIDSPLFKEVHSEEKWLKEFNNKKENHPRYQLLNELAPDYYGNTDNFLNGDFTETLAENNFMRVARLIENNKRVYEQTKWTFAAFARCSTGLYVRDETYDWLVSKRIFNDPKLASQEPPKVYGFGLEIDGQRLKVEPPKKIYPNATTSDVISLLTEPFGIDTEDWSMDFKSAGGRLAFRERFGTPTGPPASFLKALKETWIEWPLFSDLSCKELIQISINKMKNIKALETIRQEHLATNIIPSRKPLISKCTSCHTKFDGYTPQIPFDNAKEMSKILLASRYKRGTLLEEIKYRTSQHASSKDQMPPENYFGPNERAELLDYLNNLVN